MIRWRTLLLFYFIIYSESPPVRNALKHVTGIRGGDVILSCDFKAGEISDIVLTSLSKNILDCQNEQCESKNGRVFKEGSCGVIIKNLRLRDAGKYYLRVHYTDDGQKEVIRQKLEYHLHIQDEISVNTGEELKMDVLLINAEKVDTNSSGQWTEVWTRGHGVSSDRLTDSDGNLTINEFTSTDAGTYRVLDSEGQILISITVSESSETEERKDDHKNTPPLIIGLSVGGALVLVVALVVAYFIWKSKYQNRNADRGEYQGARLNAQNSP